MIYRIHYDHQFAECVCLHCKRARAELTAVLVDDGQGLRERRVAEGRRRQGQSCMSLCCHFTDNSHIVIYNASQSQCVCFLQSSAVLSAL